MIDKIKNLSKEIGSNLDFGKAVRDLLEKEERRSKVVPTSMYDTPINETCHKGDECGKIGLSCRNPNCPHT